MVLVDAVSNPVQMGPCTTKVPLLQTPLAANNSKQATTNTIEDLTILLEHKADKLSG